MTKKTRHTAAARGFLKGMFVILAITSLIGPVAGQVHLGRVEVRVIDDSKNTPINDVKVMLVNTKTGQTMSAITSKEGLAVFDKVPPGLYKISAEADNFTPKPLPDIELTEGEKLSTELKLSPKELEVSAAAVIAQASPSPLETTKEEQQEQVSPLPNLNNDLTPLLQVAPGPVATGSSALGRVIVDGKGNDQQTVRLDSVDFTVLSDLPLADPAIDAVSSFQKPEVAGDLDSSGFQRGAFAPMSGPGTGSVAETVTYKGIRETAPLKVSVWRAQVYGEHRNDVFNARNFFDFDGKNALRRSRFGGKAGGPLDNGDHNFLFLAYDGIRGRTERNVYEAIPKDALCCVVGPLAELMPSYLPTGTHIVQGASVNPDFAVARRRNRTTVASNAINLRYDYYPFTGAKDPQGNPLPKSNDVFTLRFTHQAAENVVPDGVTGRQQRQQVNFTNVLANLLLATSGSTHNLKFGLNRIHANVNIENSTRLDAALTEALLTIGGSVKTLGLPSQVNSVPIATLGGLMKSPGRGFTLNPLSFSLGYDSFWEVFDRSELRFGFEARFIRMNFDRLGGLTYTFPNLAAVRAGTPGSITFLSDLSKAAPFSSGSGPRQARQEYYLGYFQMTTPIGTPQPNPTNGKTESRLILTYGFRYDYFGPSRERDNRAVVIDPQTGEILPPGTSFYRATKLNFQPRLSIVYRLHDTNFLRNMVVRAGIGVYSGVPRTGDLLLPIESDRFSTGINGGSFPVSPADVVSGFMLNPETRQFQPLAFARDFTGVERLYKWDAQVTQTIRGYDFGLLYTGNVGRNLALANIANRIIDVTTNSDPTKPAIVVREFDTERNGQVFKPFGEFFFRTGNGHSSYNALTVLFRRNVRAEKPAQPSSWLREAVMNLNVQYTISRNIGNASGTVASDPFNLESDFGYNAADARHNFKLSAVYDLWRVKNASLTNPLLGWKIMPSLKASSGLPLIVRINRPDIVYKDSLGNIFSTPAVGRTALINTPGGGETGGARVPDLLPGVNPYLRNGLELLNPAAFAIPAPGTFGNLRRGALRGPAIVQFDLGLRRNLFRSEKQKVSGEFQADFYNLFNRANFSNPTAALPGSLGTSIADNQLQPGVPFTRASAGSFGIVSAADPGRLIQFSLTLRFNDGFTK